MLKKYLVAVIIASSLTTIVNAAPPTTFMNGVSGGLNAGYQLNKAPLAKYINYNTPTLGAHIDYNRIISSAIFLGSGLDVSYAFRKGNSIQNPSDKNDFRMLKRTLTGALTLRAGMISGPMAFEINGALLVTKWNFSGRDALAKNLNRWRPGFAPGVAMTVAVDEKKKMSIGALYRYEIYSKGSKAYNPVPRYNAHVVLLKFNMHL